MNGENKLALKASISSAGSHVVMLHGAALIKNNTEMTTESARLDPRHKRATPHKPVIRKQVNVEPDNEKTPPEDARHVEGQRQ